MGARTTCLLLVIACCAGCSRRQVADQGAARPSAARSAGPLAPAEPPAAPQPAAPLPPWPPPSPPNAAAARPAPTDEAADEKKPRDFPAEFSAKLGGLGACVQPRPPEQAGAIAIAVTGYVMPSGAVGRGEVDSSQLQPEESACVRARVEGVRFAPPIENAPFAVRASLTVNPKLAAVDATKAQAAKVDGLGMVVTQVPSGEGITPGVVPTPDPGVLPPPDPGVLPTPDPPAQVMPIPEAIPPQ
jgi:hypothetical protein